MFLDYNQLCLCFTLSIGIALGYISKYVFSVVEPDISQEFMPPDSAYNYPGSVLNCIHCCVNVHSLLKYYKVCLNVTFVMRSHPRCAYGQWIT